MTSDDFDPHAQVLAHLGKASDGHALATLIIASANDAVMAVDLGGKILVWNRGCETLFGWTADEAVGRSAAMLLPEARRGEFDRALLAGASVPDGAALETERLHRSGAVLPVSCRSSPIIDATGAVLGVCAIIRENGRELNLRRQLERSRQMAVARFEQSVLAQATLSADGFILEANPALVRLAGYPSRDMLGRPLTEFMAEPDTVVSQGRGQVSRGAVSVLQGLKLLRHAGGHSVETRLSVFPVRDDSGEILRLEAMIEDVSETAAVQRELQLREARWRSLASHSTDVALLCDPNARLLFASEAALAVFGYETDALADADGWAFVHPDDVDGAKAMWAAVEAGELGTSMTFELRLRHADGSWRWTEETLTSQLDDPAVQAMVVNLVDISEQKSAEAVLDELAGTDTLTGIATRAPLMSALDTAFAAGLAETTAVAVLDITRLKLINDTYGHRSGDDVLAEVAQRLTRVIDGQGIVARIGGDEFAVLLTNSHDITDVFEACAALLDAVEAPLPLDEHQLMLTATIGAAAGPAVDSGALLASAESALATAKEGLTGPMHVVRAESASAAVCRARLIEDLRRGLEQDELVVHFQPVIALGDGRPVAAEALVRWMHPEKGLLSPGAFIDAAEESGLIIGVGEVVLAAACRAAARWADVGGRGQFHVAVNLSAKQLTRGGIVDVVRQALRASGAAPQNLMLEVTESAVMSDVEAAVATLQQLRDLGIAIAVDDFGTGYSSLTYLKQFPVTTLKIDRSFVSGLGKNADDAAIVTSVINLARAMGLDCIAEGVETEPQRLVLQALGCSYGQGFLWSPGLEAETFHSWLGSAAVADRRSVAPTPLKMLEEDAGVARQLQLARNPRAEPAMLGRVDDLIAAGASPTTIAAALNADQQFTAEGKRWTSRTVAQLMATRQLL